MQNDIAVRLNSNNNSSNFQYGESAGYSPALSSLTTEGAEDAEFPADAESLVYYFSIEIVPIPPSYGNNYTFFRDPVRAKMILKFMKFYSWCPELKGSPYDQRRQQLKLHLKLGDGKFSSQLGTFMGVKFRFLKDNGWVSGDKSNPPVKYHEPTDHWLEQTWDGIIRLGRNNPTNRLTSLKRAAPPLSHQDSTCTRRKGRKRNTRNIYAAVNSIPHAETLNSEYSPVTRGSAGENTGVERSHEDTSGNTEPIIHNLVAPDDSISAAHSNHRNSNILLIGASSTATERSSRRLEHGDVESYFNASEFSALLEGLSEPEPVEHIAEGATVQTVDENATVSENQIQLSDIQEHTRQAGNAHHAPSVNESRQTLETLVKLERSCRTACNANVAERKELKSIHDQLSSDNNKLVEEIKAFNADYKEANRRLKNKTPPSPASDDFPNRASTPFHQKAVDIRRKLADPEWYESRTVAKAVLLEEIAKVSKNIEDLKAQYDVKAEELKRLRAVIVEEKAREKARIASLLEGLERCDTLADPQSEWIPEMELDSEEED